MDDVITGQVAAILDERQLVINVGSQSGVRIGAKFRVLSEYKVEIPDPITGETIGYIDREKVRVIVSEVQEKMSICRTYRKETFPSGPLNITISGIAALSDFVKPAQEVLEKLRVNNHDRIPPLPDEESYVRRGDKVIQLVGPDDD